MKTKDDQLGLSFLDDSSDITPKHSVTSTVVVQKPAQISEPTPVTLTVSPLRYLVAVRHGDYESVIDPANKSEFEVLLNAEGVKQMHAIVSSLETRLGDEFFSEGLTEIVDHEKNPEPHIIAPYKMVLITKGTPRVMQSAHIINTDLARKYFSQIKKKHSDKSQKDIEHIEFIAGRYLEHNQAEIFFSELLFRDIFTPNPYVNSTRMLVMIGHNGYVSRQLCGLVHILNNQEYDIELGKGKGILYDIKKSEMISLPEGNFVSPETPKK